MLKILLLVTTLFSPLEKGFAEGGTAVGNGGGFGEMKAAYLFYELPKILEKTQMHPEFFNFLKTSPVVTGLGFSSKCVSMNRSYVLHQPFMIPSCILYTEINSELGKRPKTAQEIGAIVFGISYLAFDNDMTWEEALLKGGEIFANLRFTEVSAPIISRSRVIAALRVWELTAKEFLTDNLQITLELPKQSLNILDQLKDELECKKIDTFTSHYLSLKSRAQNSFFAVGPITWSCNDQSFTGELYLKKKTTESEEVSLRLRVRKKRSI